MSDEPAYLRNLKRLTRADPTFNHIEALERELYGASDRTTAVMLGAMLDTYLGRLLAIQMRAEMKTSEKRELFENRGPLSTFSSRIMMAYALKVIGPITRTDLDLIRTLRNEFAHSRMTFDFNTAEIAAVCAELQTPNLPETTIPPDYLRRMPQPEQERGLTHPKTRYVTACHTIAYRMHVKRDGVQAGDVVFKNDDPLP